MRVAHNVAIPHERTGRQQVSHLKRPAYSAKYRVTKPSQGIASLGKNPTETDDDYHEQHTQP